MTTTPGLMNESDASDQQTVYLGYRFNNKQQPVSMGTCSFDCHMTRSQKYCIDQTNSTRLFHDKQLRRKIENCSFF